MTINYKRELEAAAKNMILIHRPDTLIKLVLRTTVRKARLTHAAALLYDKKKNIYIFAESKGETGVKVPSGYVRLDPNSGLIKFFREKKNYLLHKEGVLEFAEISNFLKTKKELFAKDKLLKSYLQETKYQMQLFDAYLCIPSYIHGTLLGLLLLGSKKSEQPFSKEEINFFVALTHDVTMAVRNAQLFEELKSELDKNHSLFIHTAQALASAIDAKDHYTHGHTERVTQYCMAIGRELIKRKKIRVTGNFLETLRVSSLLHDIGKIGIPDDLLSKKGPLTEDERRDIEEHAMIGSSILNPLEELSDAITAVKQHHENFDGTGYPKGVKADEINIYARIIRVADSYDAMTSDRPYRKAFSDQQAFEELRQYSGTQYDPTVVKVFIDIYRRGDL
ncbi:MAG: HD-GYP domain-containing protein [Candidatus Omnitrophica bacterium]|nr:HD-GYP domain-containing protein [Candidatus Omnitrophota bacterium]